MSEESVQLPPALYAQAQRLVEAGHYPSMQELLIAAVQDLIARSARDSALRLRLLQHAINELRTSMEKLLDIRDQLHPASSVPLAQVLLDFREVEARINDVRHLLASEPNLDDVQSKLTRLIASDDRTDFTLESIGARLEAVLRYRQRNQDLVPLDAVGEIREAAQEARWVQSASTGIASVTCELLEIIDRLGKHSISQSTLNEEQEHAPADRG